MTYNTHKTPVIFRQKLSFLVRYLTNIFALHLAFLGKDILYKFIECECNTMSHCVLYNLFIIQFKRE